MYHGTTNSIAKVWDRVGGAAISEIPSGAYVTGQRPVNGYAFIYAGSYNGHTWKAGYTKAGWLSNYVEAVVQPPMPTVTRTHVIEVFSDGSVKIDGVAIA